MVDGSLLQDRYRLERRLASGGMGSVYEGTDERLHRRVAVKLLRDELADDPRFVERFRREARAVASLSHPNIASVYDFGEDAGKPFMIMEFAAGRDLAQIIKTDAPLPIERAVHIGEQLCEALEHAHAAGVIHRDVKPANVIVDSGDRVRVTDFGIARAAGDSTLTATGSVLGTANYLSPEQAAGRALTPASDLYSAGIVLYEMVTGTVPFSGESAIAVAMRHMNEDVPSARQANPAVPFELDAVVRRAAARDPAARFHSAQQMADALRHSLQPTATGAPTLVAGAVPRPAAPTQSVWPVPGRRYDPRRVRRAVVLTLVVLALLVGGLLAFRLLTDEDAPAAGRRNPPDERADGDSEQVPQEPTEEETVTPSPSPSGILITDGFIGANSKEVEQLLESQGVSVETIDQDSEEEKFTILAVDPPPGTTVSEGDTVTLTVSTGKVSDEGDDDD
jgi:eukaryotic-like serine/threonine-protein kinase